MTRRLLILLTILCGACGGGGDHEGQVDAGFEKEVAYNPKDAGWGLIDGGATDTPAAQDTPPGLDTPPAPDLPPVPPDQDDDGIPDEYDPFPGDPNKPGTGSAMSVYMHTAGSLWKLDVKTYAVSKIGDFDWPGGIFSSDQMTDIAMDRYGVLYGVSFDSAYVCHPQTAECWDLGSLPDSFNGLTMIPEGIIEPDRDVMIGISQEGGWYRLDVSGTNISVSKLGQYGGPYSSSGDAYSIAGLGTFASVNKEGVSDDLMVELDPQTGAVIKELGVLDGFSSVWGVAGWTGNAFAFDAAGDIVIVDTATGQVTQVIEETSEAWWGAGVRTLIF